NELKKQLTMKYIPLPPLDFNDHFRHTDAEYYMLAGINKVNFEHLCATVNMRNTDNRSLSMAVGCLLVKLRLGEPNTVLATLFSFSDKRTVGHILDRARIALLRDFVPDNLGFQHITRDQVINEHTRSLVKQLLCDGTKINASTTVPDFPKLTEDNLREITLGVFQLKQARSYTIEHITDDGDDIVPDAC
ncbi:unnamed protein product, partial [Didymodactylos carnosus]